MIRKLLAYGLAAGLTAGVGLAGAEAKQRVHPAKMLRHARVVPPATSSSFEPARMIEVRPGLIISSYDCVTDEGYGRWRPCSTSNRDGP